MKYDVLGMGSLAVDFISAIKTWPEKGTKNPMSSFDIYDGGLTGTALTTVARLGGKAGFIGFEGDSEMAQRSFNALRNEGVDTSMSLRKPGSEPIVAMIFSSESEEDRNVFFRKENLSFPLPAQLKDKNWMKKAKVFFTDHVAGEAAVAFASEALQNGLHVITDIERIQDNTDSLLIHSSHIIVGEKFARDYSGSDNLGDQVRALRKSREQIIIITRGAKGFRFSYNGLCHDIPGHKVEVKDTTGCGDVFHGAYALYLARGFKAQTAALWANGAAAISARERGGRTGIPVAKELQDFMNQSMSRKVIFRDC